MITQLTNGMRSKSTLSSKSVNTLDKMPDFMQGVLNKDYSLTCIDEFKTRLNRCYSTIASLYEVLDMETRLKGTLGKSYERFEERTSINRIKDVFGESMLLDSKNHKYFKTDVTLWNLTNEITALSSNIEQNNLVVDSSTNLRLQILGGDFMFREPNLVPGNLKQAFK